LTGNQSDNTVKKNIVQFFTVFGGYTLLVVLLFYPLLFQSSTLIAPDTLVPQASVIALERLQAATGVYPLWQPWVFSGMPTVEAFSYLSGLYMPNVVFTLLHVDAIVLQLLHLAFAGFGVFLLLREFRLGVLASFFSGAVFMLNPYMTAMLVHGHGSQLMTLAYMPWLLWATMRLFERGGIADAATLAILAGFQLQRAHVQIAYYSWMLMLAFFIFLRFTTKNKMRGHGDGKKGGHEGRPYGVLLLLIVALGCGVAMSASIYLPASQYAAWSVRGMAASGGGSSWEYATLWSMHPLELFTFLVPGAFGFGGVTYWGFMPFTDFPHYAGIVVLLLALGGAAVRRNEPITWFFALGALLSLLLSFGSFFTPVFDLFYNFAPLFSRFRVPSMALVMLYLILSLLAAFGFHELFQRLQEKPERLLKPLRIGSLLLAVFLVLFLALEQPIEGFFRSLFPAPPVENFDLAFMVGKVRWDNLHGSFLTVTLLVALSAALLWLTIKKMLSLKVAGVLLILLALGDILWLDMQIVYPSASSLRFSVLAESRTVEPAFRHDDITRYLASQKGPFRIYPAGPLFGENKFALFGIESAGGYHPAKLKIYEEFLAKTGNLASINILRMLNVGYIISPAPLLHPALELLKTGPLQLASGPVTVYLYRLQGTAPRAWFAGRVSAIQSDEELFVRILDEKAPAGEAYVDGSLWSGTRTFAAATVTSLDTKAESMTLKVSVPAEAFLVVSEVYYPLRWKVVVDGKAASMVKVNGLLRGVIIPPGSREVRFQYDRSGFETGRNVSLAAFLVALLMMAGGLLSTQLHKIGGKWTFRGL